MGCKTVGICGSDEKVELAKSKFGFDEAINYKTSENLRKDIKKACPDGVDIYFENVGGVIADAVHARMNPFGRIPVCGTISTYNNTEIATGPRIEHMLIRKSVLMQGFIYSNFSSKIGEALTNLNTWLAEGKLTYEETVVEGFENIPNAFFQLFEGKNKGKIVVKI